MSNIVVVSGIHRSGTTFLGEILSRTNSLSCWHEPFNPVFGIEGLKLAYPYAGPTGECLPDGVESAMMEVLNLKCKFRKHIPGEIGWKAIARLVVGGRGDIDKIKILFERYILNNNKQLLLKDPFLVLLVPYLVGNFDAKVIVSVRHPCAVWASVKRMNWTFDFSNFGGETFWRELDMTDDDLNRLPEVEKIAFLWRFIYERVVKWVDVKRGCLLFKHEAMCLNPMAELESVLDFVGILKPRNFQSLIEEYMVGGAIEVASGRLHEFKRDSRSMVDNWRSKLNDHDVCVIKEITGSVVESIYGGWEIYS